MTLDPRTMPETGKPRRTWKFFAAFMSNLTFVFAQAAECALTSLAANLVNLFRNRRANFPLSENLVDRFGWFLIVVEPFSSIV